MLTVGPQLSSVFSHATLSVTSQSVTLHTALLKYEAQSSEKV